jgi:hypothetical protein
MSRELPQKPNLAYLKKQAKELLRAMRQGTRNIRLPMNTVSPLGRS